MEQQFISCNKNFRTTALIGSAHEIGVDLNIGIGRYQIEVNWAMMHIRKRMSKAVNLEATETFNMVAEGESNFDVSKLPVALQSLGLSSKIDHSKLSEGSTSIDLSLFLQIVSVCIDDPDWSVAEIREAFATFDREGSGIGEKNVVNSVFMKLGEVLSDKNIDDQIIGTSNLGHEGRISVEEFILLCKNSDENDEEAPDG